VSLLFDSIPAMIVLTGALVGIAAALPGTFLVLRGSSMLADAISHAILLGIVGVWLLTGATGGPLQLVGAAAAGLACVWLVEGLTRSGLVRSDAAIGLVFPALFALGVLLVNLNARNLHLDADAVLLGQIGLVWIDTIPLAGVEVPRAVVTLAVVAAVNAAFVAAFWKELKLSSFDPGLAEALGFRPERLGRVLLVLTSLTAVAAFEAVGAVLFVAFVVVPPATALMLTDRLGRAVAGACALAVAAAAGGYGLAEAGDVSIAGSMAALAGAGFAAAFLLAPGRGVLARRLQARRVRADTDAHALVAHLLTHGGAEGRANAETEAQALRDHLMWTEARAREAILRGLDRALLLREGEVLALTSKGRAVAEETLAPHAPRRPARPG
jgi:manganese/zinc/iron transport system permease protein